MATETWYVLDDGSVANPRDVMHDDKGKLRHKDGRAVAYAPHGPRSRSVDPAEEAAKEARAAKPKAAAKEIKPEEPKAGYRTRESKAD